ncbi:scavenger receptor cysteine-rich domain-containing group B protein-like [Perca fluviatilis]|uniref:scavenger receptor cysteine-rich domain-containing group B protein-like n=1 Tax=Perca fluviatilis TaxID=8168 RepID=UPI001965F4C3|nr:scavenger receptor cysteine-rich domain-containing group B protein-like [Perca fluviatilis]
MGSDGRDMLHLDMDHLLLLLWSSGLQAEGKHNSTESIRVVGGDSRCAGILELEHLGEWRPVYYFEMDPDWTLKTAAVACRELGCGSAVRRENKVLRQICVEDQL